MIAVCNIAVSSCNGEERYFEVDPFSLWQHNLLEITLRGDQANIAKVLTLRRRVDPGAYCFLLSSFLIHRDFSVNRCCAYVRPFGLDASCNSSRYIWAETKL
jgi:hypothetical protein